MTLADLATTSWVGQNELWLDPLGNDADIGACTVTVTSSGIAYRWARDGTPHDGSVVIDPNGATFIDTFHAVNGMRCTVNPNPLALFDIRGTYSGGKGPDWGWRITLSYRRFSDELVVQMTNIAPWGEEVRAVRMVCTRA